MILEKQGSTRWIWSNDVMLIIMNPIQSVLIDLSFPQIIY